MGETMSRKYRLTKYACCVSYLSMAAVITLSPLLFEIFHRTYGISYTRLGMLVLFNFFSQLTVDLIFSFFTKRFNIPLTVKITPAITFAGLIVYSVLPVVNPANAWFWIVTGTVVFSVSAGLSEVLLSPTVAALPSDDPGREMSSFHAVYAWGAVFVVLFSTAFIRIAGDKYWFVLGLIFAAFPVIAAILFALGEMPVMNTGSPVSANGKENGGLKAVLLFVMCIFFGSCAENTMSQWCSSFAETALSVPKIVGDTAGVALFSVMLGLARTLYGKYGKNIYRVLLFSFCGAGVCYIVNGLVSVPAVCLVSCAVCGFFVSMLWPGTLIWAEENMPGAGVVVYALLAAGGDFGASVAPQLMGFITDRVAASALASAFADKYGMLPEQTGMKCGMLISVLFCLAGITVVLTIRKRIVKQKKT